MKENQNIIILEQSVLECKGKFRQKKIKKIKIYFHSKYFPFSAKDN